MAEARNEEVKKAADLVEELLADPEVQELYDARLMARFNYVTSMAGAKEAGLKEGLEEGREKGLQEGRKKGLQEGRKEGRKEGQKEKSKEIAKKLKNINMPEEEICKITGLTKDELNEL